MIFFLYDLFDRVGYFLWERFDGLCYRWDVWRHGPICYLVRADGEEDALFLDDAQAYARARELAASGREASVHSYWDGIVGQPMAAFSRPVLKATPRRRPSALAERLG